MELAVEILFLQKGQQRDAPTEQWLSILAVNSSGRKSAVSTMIIVQSDANLLEIVRRHHTDSGIPNPSAHVGQNQPQDRARERHADSPASQTPAL